MRSFSRVFHYRLPEPGAEEAAVLQVQVSGSAEAACAAGACPGAQQNQEEKPFSHAVSFQHPLDNA